MSSSAITSLTGSKVLQVVQGTLTSSASTSSTSFTDTGITVTITPSSANSKILVMAFVSCGNDASSAVHLSLLRDSTEILLGDAASARTRDTTQGWTSSTGVMQSSAINYLDSPATVSATVYKIQYLSKSGPNAYINRTAADTDTLVFGRGASTIIAMEIAG